MMKQIFYFLLISLLLSCSETVLDEQQDISDKMVEVSFDLGGDYSVDFENITRASVSTGDLVGIRIDEDGVEYACGLFNGAPRSSVYLKANKTYVITCRIVKDGVSKIHHTSLNGVPGGDYYYWPFVCSANGAGTYLKDSFFYKKSPIVGYPSFSYLDTDRYSSENSSSYVVRPAGIESYYGEVRDYHPMEKGIVKLNLKCNKAPNVTLNFTSDVPDGVVEGTMTYYGYTKQTWPLSQENTIDFGRSIAPMAKIIDGTWWGGVEQLDLSLTWKRGPEASSFVTIHKDVTLTKTLYLDNDKNYTVNLHFRGQSDSDPEVWVGVDVDPDHPGDLDEEDDNNE